jgi:hypothetical protein
VELVGTGAAGEALEENRHERPVALILLARAQRAGAPPVPPGGGHRPTAGSPHHRRARGALPSVAAVLVGIKDHAGPGRLQERQRALRNDRGQGKARGDRIVRQREHLAKREVHVPRGEHDAGGIVVVRRDELAAFFFHATGSANFMTSMFMSRRKMMDCAHPRFLFDVVVDQRASMACVVKIPACG